MQKKIKKTISKSDILLDNIIPTITNNLSEKNIILENDIEPIQNKKTNKKNNKKLDTKITSTNMEIDEVEIQNIEKMEKISIKKSSTKDEIWKHIIKELQIDCKSNNDIIITSEKIKNCGKTWKGKANQFEPRLLCKQDTEDDRPQIFKQNNLNIISIKNGEYLLTKNSIYYVLEYPEINFTEIKKPKFTPFLNYGNSESSLLDILRYSGIFEENIYLGEKILYGPWLSGRHRCTFNTKIGDKIIDIYGSQFETDACFESENKILLVECKTLNSISSFNIRQLYYPYRTIHDIFNGSKQIITLFINKDKNNFIHIWKFDFINPMVLSSIKLIDYKKYKLV